MEKRLYVNPELCTGCNRCSLICSALKEGAFHPAKSRIHINNYALHGYSYPSICFQCEDAACMDVCPTEALIRSDNGVVQLVADDCTGCAECVDACQYGMIQMNQDTDLAVKCDYCEGDPVCVSECEFNAITYQIIETEKQASRDKQMKVMSDANAPFLKRHTIANVFLKEARNV
jgi:anaerobic carbon-monoxide dehydrogenase iron sulfur subunit